MVLFSISWVTIRLLYLICLLNIGRVKWSLMTSCFMLCFEKCSVTCSMASWWNVISENDFSRAFMIKTTIPNQRILGNDEKFPSSSHRSAYSLIRFFSCLDNQHHFQEISSFSLLGFPCERNRFIKKDGILMTFDLSRNLPWLVWQHHPHSKKADFRFVSLFPCHSQNIWLSAC